MLVMRKPQTKIRWTIAALILIVMAALAWLITSIYVEREQRYRHQIESSIKITNDTLLQNLVQWRSRITATASSISDDLLFARTLSSWLTTRSQAHKEDLVLRMRTLTERHEYANVFVLDTQGKFLLSVTDIQAKSLGTHEHAALRRALDNAEAVVIEPYQQTQFAYPTLTVIAPVFDGWEPIGAVWMVVDLRATLFPLLETTQLSRATAESMLLISNEREVIHINPLRHRPSHALDTFAALTNKELVAVQAFAGRRGVIYGQDYRQHQVLAASSVVPDSPWMLITKIDVSEAFASDQHNEGLVLGLSMGAIALIMLTSILCWMWLTSKREQALKRQLEKNIRWLERAQRTASIGFFTIDFERKEVFLCAMAAEILGTGPANKMHFRDLVQHMPAFQTKANLRKLMKLRHLQDAQKIELDLHTARQGTRTLECWLEIEEPTSPGNNRKIIGTLQDITQRKMIDVALDKYRNLLEFQARKDSLTGLSNRRSLDEELDREWRRALREQLPLSVLVIDIDHFKGYNDKYGHLQGDECLKQVATLLESHLLRPRDQVFRYGGEEFIALLPNTTPEQAMEVAQHLCQAVHALHIENTASRHYGVVTISVGVASRSASQIPGTHVSSLIAAADAALYQAKAMGRNQAHGAHQTPAPSPETTQV